jgi:hypothetical protein
MDGGIALLILLILGVPIFVAIWLIVRTVSARSQLEILSNRIEILEAELRRLKEKAPAEPASKPQQESHKAEATPAVEQILKQRELERSKPAPLPVAPPVHPQPIPPITPPVQPPPQPEPVFQQPPSPKPAPQPATEPAAPPPILEPIRPLHAPKPAPAFNWEQFMGVKLFAWVAGLALFLGVAFFVKYSFDNNLIPPEVRVVIGYVVGIALLVGGVLTSRKNYLVLAHTLCATGIVILYAITFAARSYYHFLDPLPAFAVMALITATGFGLAVRLNALVVAILGMLGGFLTPILLSTGVDNPGGLFGYIAILDAGLIFVALYRRWFFLTALAAGGTALMQMAWATKFFEPGKYFEGNKIFIPLAILAGFNALYLFAAWLTKRRGQTDRWLSCSALGLVTVALGFALAFLGYTSLAQRPWLIFGFVFLIDLVVIALVLLDHEIAPAQPIAGLLVFALLGFWTGNSLSNELLNTGLVLYLIFAILHSVFPVLLQRLRGITTTLWGTQIFPPLALVLVLIPIFHLAEVSFVVWPFVLLVDILAIALAVMTLSVAPIIIVLLLTLAATGALIFKIPETLIGLSTSFFLLGVFTCFFFAVSIWLIRRFSPNVFQTGLRFTQGANNTADMAATLPISSAVLPFLLLIMATMRLPLTNPAPVFGLALLLVVLLLGVTRLLLVDWMPIIGLVCVAALEAAWHFNRFEGGTMLEATRCAPIVPLMWYLIFFAIFAVFPFLFLRYFSEKIIPWAAAALAGPLQFLLIYRIIKLAYPNEVMGLVPAAFAVPALASLFIILKTVPSTSPARLGQLAWFGGVALFFITLVFPIQFEHQWITIGWALEGAALLWLFHRVPHPGLRLVGVGLLIAAFARLALNPYVLGYHPRAATAIFNWYFYTYGIVTFCLFAGASLLAPPRNRVAELNIPPVLFTLGTILAFILLNIEIADYFSEPGSTLTFDFNANFARDMTYSIGWALFALILLVVGIWRKLRGARYSAIGLLVVTIIKLFLHDLAQLNELYRIGALVGVSIIVMFASVAYQRFFAATGKKDEPRNETGV